VCGHNRKFEARREANPSCNVCILLGVTGTLQLDVKAIRKQCGPRLRELLSRRLVIGQQGMADITEGSP